DSAIPFDLGANTDGVSRLWARAVTVPDIYASRPLSVSANPLTTTVGTPFSGVVGTIVDADPTATASRYSVTINWGDGSSPTVGTVTALPSGGFQVIGSHNYGSPGSFAIAVTAIDTTRGPTGRLGTSTANAVVSPKPVETIGPNVISIQAVNPTMTGPTRVVVNFDRALNPATASFPRNYRVAIFIQGPRGGGRYVRVPVRWAIYDPNTLAVTLILRRRFDLGRPGQFRIITTSRFGLRDIQGHPLTNVEGRPADYLGTFGPVPSRTGISSRAFVGSQWLRANPFRRSR
ncbi:hypothetical protein ACYOEI_12675, partial [Singulisphaera rosea]